MIWQGAGSTVPAGDCIAHSELWDRRWTGRRDTTCREEPIDEHMLVIGNDNRPTHYVTRHDIMGESVIDLSLAK
jgi:hypothetical protein